MPEPDEDKTREDTAARESGLTSDPDPIGAPAWSPPRVLGPYRVLESLGAGGQGQVFLAEDTRLGRRVALKVLSPSWLRSGEARTRFQREAMAASRLDHPGICTVYEAGEASGVPYIAMRYVEGDTLAKTIHFPTVSGPSGDSSRLHRDEILRRVLLVERTARALHAAHQSGLIHRDIKPGNIVVTPEGDPVILDFGLAREELSEGLTRSGDLLGTPAYMSPEQLTAQRIPLDRRTDIYSLGVTLYECLTLRHPFEGDTREALYQQILARDPPRPRKLDPRIARDLEVVIETAMAKDPARRYATALDLADDLKRVRGGESIRARAATRRERLWRWCRRNPALSSTGAVAGIAIVAAVALSLLYAVQERRNALELRMRLADSYLVRGQMLCESGDVARGLHWIARALRQFPEDSELARVARMQVAGWKVEGRFPEKVLLSRGPVMNALLSPDGKLVLADTLDGPLLWSPFENRILHRFHETYARVAAFSRDGSRCALARDAMVRVWSCVTGEPMGSELPHPSTPVAIAFGPGGCLITAAGREVVSWSPETGERRRIAELDGNVTSLEVRTDPGIILAAWGGAVGAWWHESGETLGPPVRDGSNLVEARLDRRGDRILTRSKDGPARVWSAATGEPLTRPLEHAGGVTSMSWSPRDDRILTGGKDRAARFWEGATGKPLCAGLGHGKAVTFVAFSPDGALAATGSLEGTVRLWEVPSEPLPPLSPVLARPLGAPFYHNDDLDAVAFSADGRHILTASGAEARIWAATSGDLESVKVEQNQGITSVAFGPDGRWFATGSRRLDAIRIWSSETGEILGSLPGQPGTLMGWSLAISPDGRSILAGHGEDGARLWSVSTQQPTGNPLRHGGVVRDVAFSPDGKLALTGGFDGRCLLWRIEDGARIGKPMAHAGFVEDVGFSPNGELILTGSADGTAKLWSAISCDPTGWEVRHGAPVLAAALSESARIVATGGRDNAVRFWSLDTGAQARSLLQHPYWVEDVAFSKDGKLILTGCADGAARIWSVEIGRTIGPPFRHDGDVFSAAFSPDERRLVTGGNDRTAKVWSVPIPVEGDLDAIIQGIESLTRMRMGEDDVIGWTDVVRP